jgi:hypothetical protein
VREQKKRIEKKRHYQGKGNAWAVFEKGGVTVVVRWECWWLYIRVDFERDLPTGPQRCVTFVWTTTQGDFVAYCNLRRRWSDDKS